MDKAILLVDDEAIILLSLRQELKGKLGTGYRYEIARDATEALSLLQELDSAGVEVALVVSDWLMPGIKGDEFIIRLRESRPEVRTIMITGQADESQLDRLRASGTLDALFRKPWPAGRLVAECQRLLALPA